MRPNTALTTSTTPPPTPKSKPKPTIFGLPTLVGLALVVPPSVLGSLTGLTQPLASGSVLASTFASAPSPARPTRAAPPPPPTPASPPAAPPVSTPASAPAVPSAAPAGASSLAQPKADDPAFIAACVKAADYSASMSGRAVRVMVDGKLAFERADNGWSLSRPHPLASGTKSFTGVMAMMAVQDGLLTLDELASDTLTEWKADPRKSRITVRHLLTLSSGLDPGDGVLGTRPGRSNILGEGAERRAERLARQGGGQAPPDDLCKAAMGLKTNFDPGTRFEYGPSHFYAFAELLKRKLAASDLPTKTVLDYLRDRVMRPVGIEVARIGRDAAGNPNLPGGMMLTPAEWAKFGQFVLDEGSVRQPDAQGAITMKNLLRPELLAQCFEASKANPTYGLTWWLRSSGAPVADGADARGAGADAQADGADGQTQEQRLRRRALDVQNQVLLGPDGEAITVYMAAGLGKQRLYVLPQLKLVVVRFAEATAQGNRFDDVVFLKTLLGVNTR
jgi:CubicO group peptidase (beta-lactamase class C family)